MGDKQEMEDDWEDMEKVAAKLLVPGVSDQQVTDFYNKWAKCGYDQIGDNFSYPQELLAEEMLNLFPSNRDKAVILDVGAGTGISGQKLKEIGFGTVDALEPAVDMLRVAQEKNVYRRVYTCPLTGEPCEIPADSYDGIILVGVVGHGHLPCAAFEEMARIVKPGGYIVNCIRAAYLQEVPDYIANWNSMISRLEKEGRWTVKKMQPYQNHFIGKDGLLTVFQILK